MRASSTSTPNPFGTRHAFYAGDTGGAIIGHHLDIYDWRGRAAQDTWGVRHVTVTPAPSPGAGNLLGEITPTAPSQPAATPPTAVCASAVGWPLPLTAGQQAKVLPSGLAAAPSNAPSAVKLAIAAGNQLISKPYIWGGGHGVPLSELDAGYDCSGATSYILHAAGALGPYAADSDAARELRTTRPGCMDHRVRKLGPRVHRHGRDRDEHRVVRAGQPNRPRQRTPVATRVHDRSPVRGRPVRRLRPTPPRRPLNHAPPARHLVPRPGARRGLAHRLRDLRPVRGHAHRHVDVDVDELRRRGGHQRGPRTGARRHDPRRRARRATPVSAGAARPTPPAALKQYAHLYVNWTADTVAAVQRELASLSEGQARAQAMQAAASYTRDQTLTHSGVANSGHLVAVTPSLTTPGQWVLVTSEQTTGKGDYSGLPPTLHVIYAQVTRTPKGWVVSEWAPQN